MFVVCLTEVKQAACCLNDIQVFHSVVNVDQCVHFQQSYRETMLAEAVARAVLLR